MTPAAFLDAITPSGIRYAAWTDGKYSSGLAKFRHRHFSNSAALSDFMLDKDADLRGKQENVYFALASFKTAKVEKTASNGDKYMACDRSRKNVAALRSLWVDMDCKPETYPTRREALAALVAAVRAGDLPTPSFIVGSGRGVHVYWTMDEDVDVETWQPMADGLRDRMAQLAIHIDSNVTIDAARILRAPGTHNRKDAANPLPVELLKVGPIWSRPNLAPYMTPLQGVARPQTATRKSSAPLRQDAPLPKAFAAASGAGDLSAGIATRTNLPSLEHVVEQCAQLREMRDTGGAHCSEPLWMAALQIAAYADDGEVWAHTLSCGHPDYTPEETAAKFARRLEAKAVAGPTLCSTFTAHNAPGCASCPHYGSIRSPIALKDMDTCLPSGYLSDSRGLFRELRDEYGAPCGTEKIAPTVVHGGRVFWRQDAGYVLRARVRRMSSDTSDADVDIEARHLVAGAGKANSYMETVIGLQPGAEKHMVNFMRSWTEELRRRRGAAQSYTALGWTKDMGAFVFGDDVVSDTPPKAGFVVDLPDGFLTAYHERGSIDEWRRAANVIAGASGVSPELSVLLATAFGAPLMALTPEPGLVMTFQSATSGVGKTKAMTTAAAVWGDPSLVMFKHNDTPLSVERRLGVAQSFPGLWDEVRPSKKDADAFKALVYHVSGGREKSRLKSDASMQSIGQWKTLIAMATNYDLLDIVSAGEDSASPAIARMLPFTLKNPPPHAPGADEALAALRDNYGGAGKLYMSFVVSRRAALTAKLAAVAEELKKHVGSSVTESRFILAGCSAVLVGAAVAKKLDLVDFDLVAMHKCIAATIAAASQRQVAAQAAAAAVESDRHGSVLSLLPELRDQWLVTDADPAAAGKVKTLLTPVFAGREPFWHVDMASETAYARAEVLRREMMRRSMPITALSDQVSAGVMRACRYSFGRGTRFSYPSGNCYAVDLRRAGMLKIVEAAFTPSSGS